MRITWISFSVCMLVAAFVNVVPAYQNGRNSKKGMVVISKSQSFYTQQQHRLQTRQIDEEYKTNMVTISASNDKNYNLVAIVKVLELISISFLLSMMVISWENLSVAHPLRQQSSPGFGGGFESTVRGLAFGREERESLPVDIEPYPSRSMIPAYNEVMLKHRTERVPTWKSQVFHKKDVLQSVKTIQLALLHLQDCKKMASSYDWELLSTSIQDPILHSRLDEACDTLKGAKEFLSSDARSEIGFDWGSCAWRHCGAFADIREALDELEHLTGILEPFEAAFVLDVAERGLHDILAVTSEFHDPTLLIPEYTPLTRMSDLQGVDGDNSLESDYLAVLSDLRISDNED